MPIHKHRNYHSNLRRHGWTKIKTAHEYQHPSHALSHPQTLHSEPNLPSQQLRGTSDLGLKIGTKFTGNHRHPNHSFFVSGFVHPWQTSIPANDCNNNHLHLVSILNAITVGSTTSVLVNQLLPLYPNSQLQFRPVIMKSHVATPITHGGIFWREGPESHYSLGEVSVHIIGLLHENSFSPERWTAFPHNEPSSKNLLYAVIIVEMGVIHSRDIASTIIWAMMFLWTIPGRTSLVMVSFCAVLVSRSESCLEVLTILSTCVVGRTKFNTWSSINSRSRNQRNITYSSICSIGF